MAAYGTMKHQCLLPITMLLISALFTPIATSSSQTEWIDPHFTEDQTVHIVNYTGDIMVGAVFPIHERDSNLNCGSLQVKLYFPSVATGLIEYFGTAGKCPTARGSCVQSTEDQRESKRKFPALVKP